MTANLRFVLQAVWQFKTAIRLIKIFLFIKRRIESVKVFAVHSIGCKPQALAETLEVNNLSCTQEFNRVSDIGVVYKAQNIVICLSCLLFCRHIFAQIAY